MTSHGMEPSQFGLAVPALAHPHSLLKEGHPERNRASLGPCKAQVSTRETLVYFQHWLVTNVTQSTKWAAGCIPAPCSPVMSQSRLHIVWSQEPVTSRWLLQHSGHHLLPGRSLLCPGGYLPVSGVLLLAVGLGLLPKCPPPARQHSCFGRRTHRLAGELCLSQR